MNNAQFIKDLESKRKWSTKVDCAIKAIKNDAKAEILVHQLGGRLLVEMQDQVTPYQLKKIAHYVEILQQDLDRTFGKSD